MLPGIIRPPSQDAYRCYLGEDMSERIGSCETCRFFAGAIAPPEGSPLSALARLRPADIGTCRRYPPSASQQHAMARQLLEQFRETGIVRGDEQEYRVDAFLGRHPFVPRVNADWWCGEWDRKGAP